MKFIQQIPNIIITCILLWTLTACAGSDQNKAPESASNSQEQATAVSPEVLFENDYSEVVKVRLAPGQALASHQGEARVIYSLSDYSIQWEENGQDEGIKSWKAGDVHAHVAGQHSAKNTGDTTAEWLAFIKKEAELPDSEENMLENDVNTVASELSTIRFENDSYKITEVNLPAGQSIPTHSGINRIIYSLSDYSLQYDSNREGSEEKSFKAGEAHWHEASEHALKNIGMTEARFLVVAYKK